MSAQDAAREWRIEPGDIINLPHTVGYTYTGHEEDRRGRDRNGEFVPIHHWGRRESADAMIAALIGGASRDAAIEAGSAA